MQNSKIFTRDNTPDFRLGVGKFVVVLRKFTKTLLYSSAEFTNSPGHYTRLPFKGRGKFVFVLRKCTKTHLQQCRIQKFSRGQYPRTFVSGAGKFVFVLRKFTKTLLYSNAEFTNSSGTIPWTPVLGRGKFVFVILKRNNTLLQQCRIQKISAMHGTHGPRFLGTGGEVASSWNCVWLRLW